MRTIIYIDGYNLFYGCLKHSQQKWLDLYALFASKILHAQNPSSDVICINYFTADIKAKVATYGMTAQHAQHAYHRALNQLYPDQIHIIHGYYSLEKARLLKHQSPPDKNSRVEVWKLEEKQTDVNLALTAYRDAVKNQAEQFVFVTNDSDLEPLLIALREDFGDKAQIGLIYPKRKSQKRPGNEKLRQYADWTRSHITDDELAMSQLPTVIPTRKKPICRPDYW